MTVDSAADPDTKRDGARVKVDAFVTISGAAQEFVFRTRDLSKSGLFLYTKVARSYPFKRGSKLALDLQAGECSVSCTVVVVRIVESASAEADHFPTGFGVRIVAMDRVARDAFDELIARAESGDRP